MKIKLLACALSFGAVMFHSCAEHDLTCVDPVSFEGEIRPIINTSCAIPSCHNGDNGQDKNWTNFETFQSKRESVRDRITRPPGTPGHMPAAGSITPDQIQLIVCWVNQGGPNN